MCTKQAESNKTKSNSSNVVVVPVQQEKTGFKAAPSQKNSMQTLKTDQNTTKLSEDDPSDRLQKQERLFQTEKSNLEQLHRSKVQSLEEQVTRCKDQLKSQKKDNDSAAAESKKALADVKSRYEKELTAWNKERETIKKNDKQVLWAHFVYILKFPAFAITLLVSFHAICLCKRLIIIPVVQLGVCYFGKILSD